MTALAARSGSARATPTGLGALVIMPMARSSSSIMAMVSPTCTTSLALYRISSITPVTVEGTSESTFTPIAWIDGRGTTNLEQHYQYLDARVPKGQTIYYQLRQLDYDGAFDYSPIRQGKLALDVEAILVYPNPTYSELTIELGEMPTNAQARLFNAKGQLLMEQGLSSTRSQMNLEALPEGIYWLRIQESKRTFVQKVIKI